MFRIELTDGSIALLGDDSNIGVVHLHHNIDPGKTGMLIEPDTTAYYESEILEVDSASGPTSISAAMTEWLLAAMQLMDHPHRTVPRRVHQSPTATEASGYFVIPLNDVCARLATRNLARRLQLSTGSGDIAYRYLH